MLTTVSPAPFTQCVILGSRVCKCFGYHCICIRLLCPVAILRMMLCCANLSRRQMRRSTLLGT